MNLDVTSDEFYGEYPRIEAEFQAYLDESLSPRGPDFLFEIVANLSLPKGAGAIDLGCGYGQHSITLAQDFGLAVLGIDPVLQHVELSNQALAEAAKQNPGLSKLVRFEAGSAEAIPAPDASVDLIWCKEVLMHVKLDEAFAECRRVLRDSGRMLIYQVLATDQAPPRDAGWYAGNIESAFVAAGFEIDQFIQLGSEGGEYSQETRGEPGRRLLHAARLLRDPDRYIARFGQVAYDIMLNDCLWHIYRMIGKLSARVYVLKIAEGRGPLRLAGSG